MTNYEREIIAKVNINRMQLEEESRIKMKTQILLDSKIKEFWSNLSFSELNWAVLKLLLRTQITHYKFENSPTLGDFYVVFTKENPKGIFLYFFSSKITDQQIKNIELVSEKLGLSWSFLVVLNQYYPGLRRRLREKPITIIDNNYLLEQTKTYLMNFNYLNIDLKKMGFVLFKFKSPNFFLTKTPTINPFKKNQSNAICEILETDSFLDCICFLCGLRLEQDKILVDKVFPEWVLSEFLLKGLCFTGVDGAKKYYSEIGIPCCKNCMDNFIVPFNDKFFYEYQNFVINEVAIHPETLFLWLSRILFALNYSQLMDSRSGIHPIFLSSFNACVSEEEKFSKALYYLQGIRKPEILKGMELGSVYNFVLNNDGVLNKYRNPNFQFSISNYSLLLKSRHVGFIALLCDNGFSKTVCQKSNIFSSFEISEDELVENYFWLNHVENCYIKNKNLYNDIGTPSSEKLLAQKREFFDKDWIQEHQDFLSNGEPKIEILAQELLNKLNQLPPE
jgi:hypothetical protein